MNTFLSSQLPNIFYLFFELYIGYILYQVHRDIAKNLFKIMLFYLIMVVDEAPGGTLRFMNLFYKFKKGAGEDHSKNLKIDNITTGTVYFSKQSYHYQRKNYSRCSYHNSVGFDKFSGNIQTSLRIHGE